MFSFKKGIIERDETIKKIRQDLLNNKKDFEKQIENEQILNQDLQNKYENLLEKKNLLKIQFNQIQQELEKTKFDYKFVIYFVFFNKISFIFF